MRSNEEKSMLWCGETVNLFNNSDENKSPEEIEFEHAEIRRKIELAAKDIEFMNTLSAEDMDIAFGSETFCKANALVKEKKSKFLPNGSVICSELDQLVANKRFLPDDEQLRFDSQKLGAKKWVTQCNVKRFKRQCYKEYETKIRNGFYTGFMASVLCIGCESIHDCIPSPYKRIIWIPSEKCIYCKGKFQPVNFKDLRYLWNLHETYKQKKFFLNKQHGVEGSIKSKLLTTHGEDLSAPFEHCWLQAQKLDQD